MDRRESALAVRQAFAAEGVRVVTHDEWDSTYDYSGSPATSQIFFNRYSVWHHTGSSALLRELERAVAQGHDPLTVAMDKIADIDHFHYWVRRWNHGFAYCGACVPWLIDGQIVWLEGRSAWYPHGAHLLDPGKNDWPTYFFIGAADDAPTDIQMEFAAVQNRVLRAVFGWEATRHNQKKHREVQGFTSTQCCDPILGAHLEEFRERSWIMNLIETAGENRHGTLAEMALANFPRGSTPKANIAAGDAYADLVAAGIAAVRQGGVPVLSVNRTGPVPAETRAALLELGVETVEVFGGPAVVAGDVRAELRSIG